MAISTQYHMPAEWEPHHGTWLAWPHRRSDWPGKFSTIPHVYAEIVRALSHGETVHILVADVQHQAKAKRLLKAVAANLSAIAFHICPTDRSWLRDSGPIFAMDAAGRKVALDWHFNAWAKYPDWSHDDRVPEFVATVRGGLPRVRPERNGHRVVLEGGSIDVNGAGVLLTTEECLLSKTQERNPPFHREDYEAVFREFLGITSVIWLNCGINGDDTHGHVDDLARFVNPTTIVTVVEDNEHDDNFMPLKENLDRLRCATKTDGSRFEIVTLPMPRPIVFDGVRLPASYANFYIANDVVIVPTFNDPADRVALGILAELFPTRKVQGIHCGDLVWGLGTLHCMTQQEPALRCV